MHNLYSTIWVAPSKYPREETARVLIQPLAVQLQAFDVYMIYIARAVIRFFKLSGLLDKAILPWPCIVMPVRQFGRHRNVTCLCPFSHLLRYQPLAIRNIAA